MTSPCILRDTKVIFTRDAAYHAVFFTRYARKKYGRRICRITRENNFGIPQNVRRGHGVLSYYLIYQQSS